MTEQMQNHIEKLDEVGGMLQEAQDCLGSESPYYRTMGHNALRDARQLLQLTTGLLRRDYGQMARARDAAIELLTTLRDGEVGKAMIARERNAVRWVIALLEGSAEEAADETMH